MKTPNFFYKNNFISNILSLVFLPISLIYSIFYILIFYYKYIFIFQNKTHDAKIICVGNLTLGGTGKTEIAMSIGRILFEKNITFCYLTKGYGRKSKDDMFLPKGFNQENFEKHADEPLLLSQIADTYIYSNRVKFLSSSIAKNYDVIILDDGLHDNTFKKDLSIALFDASSLDGNGGIIPSGPKRCPYFLFKSKIDCIIYTNFDNKSKNQSIIAKKLNCENIFYSQIKNNMKNLNGDFIAFSGLGINEKFFKYLSNNGINLLKTISFSDHYNYSNQDIENIIQMQKKLNAVGILTTSKDFIKIPKSYKNSFIRYEIFHEIDNFKKYLEKSLHFKKVI